VRATGGAVRSGTIGAARPSRPRAPHVDVHAARPEQRV